MRITFENTTHQNVDKATTSYSTTSSKGTEKTGGSSSDISGIVMDNSAYGVHGRTAEEVMQEAGLVDTTLQKDYMTVMSNSMSSEDFGRMLKDGYDPSEMEVEDIVTIVDTIKAELAKSGTKIIGYTDDLDDETLTQLTGSKVWANEIKQAFHSQDVGLTKENVEKTVAALEEALQLENLSEGEMKYMISNQMDPTIDNLYKAEFSGAYDANRQGNGYFEAGLPGYYAKKADTVEFEQLLPQVEAIIGEAGLEVDENSLADAKWIIEKGLPLTKENLILLNENKKIILPTNTPTALSAIAVALSEGKEPGEANLSEGKSKYEKAAEIMQYIEKLDLNGVADITARRQLEEIRLTMTLEANLKLVESDFSIDTEDLQATVEALKEAEKQYAMKLFPNQEEETAVESFSLYKETISITTQIPELPIDVVGKVAQPEELFNLENVYSQGKELKSTYEKANQSYETMMSTPRKDLGDSIQTAFRNTDAILEDLGIDLTEENRRAVRILGYNHTTIDEENLLAVKKADLTVRRVVEQMNPASTLRMIRDGINPLETDLNTLENYFKDINSEPAYEMEKYSTYLQRLEQSGEVTEAERESYIGIYRMLRQIEKSDGAVIGSVLQAGNELSFQNLLTAVRSAKKAGMNVVVDDSFGEVSDVVSGETKNITEQIRSALRSENEVVRLLTSNEVPVTINNLMAAQALTYQKGSVFKGLKKEIGEEQWEELSKEIIDGFTDKESAQSTYEEIENISGEAIQNALWSRNDVTSVDVKEMQLTYKQLSIVTKMSKQETYEVPIYIGEELSSLRITFMHRQEGGGTAQLTSISEKYGNITANLELTDKKVSGYMTTDKEDGKQFVDFLNSYGASLKMQDLALSDFRYIQGESKWKISQRSSVENVETKDIYQAVKTFIISFQEYSKANVEDKL